MGESSTGYGRRVDALLGILFEAIGERRLMPSLSERASYSRRHLHRLFVEQLYETPAHMRRRLVLERAAFLLGKTHRSVTDIAFDSGFGSLEAFARSFASYHGVSPSHYRRLDTRHFRLPAANGVHYSPSRTSSTPGGTEMDIIDRLLAHDAWLTRRMLERARTIPDEDLDRPVLAEDPYGVTEPTLRASLNRLVFTRERWLAAFTGATFPSFETTVGSIDEALARLDAVEGRFADYVAAIEREGRWDESFRDQTCEPGETFVFGSAIAHIITFQAQRRAATLEAFRRLGIDEFGYGDPIEWERSVS